MACAQYLGGGVFESRRLQQSWRAAAAAAAAAKQRVHKTQLQRRSCGLLLQFCYCCCTGTACYGQENERNGCSFFAFENSILLVQQGLCIQKFQLHNFLRLWLCVCGCVTTCYMFSCVLFHPGWLAVIFTILFLAQCQREREKEREKETPYSIHISSCLVQEKKRGRKLHIQYAFSCSVQERKRGRKLHIQYAFSCSIQERKTGRKLHLQYAIWKTVSDWRTISNFAKSSTRLCVCVF